MAGNAKFAWINERPESATRSTATGDQSAHRPRRSHAKSRNGCQNCKQRRIKCDESRPKCGQCLHRKVLCDYPDSVSEQLIILESPSIALVSSSRASATAQILAFLEKAGVPCSEFKNPIYKQGDGLELIDHFLDTAISWLGPPEFQRIIQREGLALSINAPYLLHAILAMSASHLSYLHPEHKKYEVAATIHYQHALTSYVSQLQTGITAENVDSVIGCGYLQTMLAFENISRLSGKEAVGGGGVAWLRTMQGIKMLQNTDSIRLHCRKSIWLPVFLESGGCEDITRHYAEDRADSWASTTSKALHSLFEASLDSSGGDSPYQQPLSILYDLMHTDKNHDTIGRFMVFIGKLPNDFVLLFEQNDSRAMLLMAYWWCALICGIDQWWIVRSATVECRRLCTSLDDVADSQVRELLRIPASKCGYVLRK